MRKQGSCLEKEIVQGTMPGARTAWMDNIKTWTSSLTECAPAAGSMKLPGVRPSVRLSVTCGRRGGFAAVSPADTRIENTLPSDLDDITDTGTFRKRLKSV